MKVLRSIRYSEDEFNIVVKVDEDDSFRIECFDTDDIAESRGISMTREQIINFIDDIKNIL